MGTRRISGIRCLLCGETTETAQIALHVHRMHPDTDAWPECWPDGEPVAHEDPDLLELP